MAKRPAKKLPTADRGVAVSHYDPIPWMETPGMYIAGRSYLDEADALEVELEMKWGRGRLPLLVSQELREKYTRQRYLMSQARWSGSLEDVRRESSRMCNAHKAIEKAAYEAGHKPIDPAIFEVTLEDGTVAAIVKDPAMANKVLAQGRKVNVYDLEEIGNMIFAFKDILKVKEHFPGATVEKTKMRIIDPLASPIGVTNEEGIFDAKPPIDGVDAFSFKDGDIPFP